MTSTTDPWAAASASTTTPAATGDVTYVGPGTHTQTAQQSPAKSADGITDPFGTSSQFAGSGGGSWDPRVPFDEIVDRTVIMVPRSFDPNAKDPFNDGQVREEYRVDLVVLDGKPFSFTYKHRPSKDADPVEATFEVTKFPFVFRQQSIAQGQLVKLLKGIDAAPDKLFAVGVLKRVPQWRDAATVTIESIEKSRKDYIEYVQKTGKTEPDTRQRSTWNLVDDPKYMTPDRWDAARNWWAQAKSTWPTLSND